MNIPHGSEAYRKLNPHLFTLGGLETDRAESVAIRALEQSVQKPAGSSKSLAIRVVVVAFRSRLLDDHDARAYACKPLTDAIAQSLGLKDDTDARISWEYHQIKSQLGPGCWVRIEMSYE